MTTTWDIADKAIAKVEAILSEVNKMADAFGGSSECRCWQDSSGDFHYTINPEYD